MHNKIAINLYQHGNDLGTLSLSAGWRWFWLHESDLLLQHVEKISTRNDESPTLFSCMNVQLCTAAKYRVWIPVRLFQLYTLLHTMRIVIVWLWSVCTCAKVCAIHNMNESHLTKQCAILSVAFAVLTAITVVLNEWKAFLMSDHGIVSWLFIFHVVECAHTQRDRETYASLELPLK